MQSGERILKLGATMEKEDSYKKWTAMLTRKEHRSWFNQGYYFFFFANLIEESEVTFGL